MAIGFVETALAIAAVTGAGITLKRRGRRGKRRQFFASQGGEAQAPVAEEAAPTTVDQPSINDDSSNSDHSLDDASNDNVSDDSASHDGASDAEITSAQAEAESETGAA